MKNYINCDIMQKVTPDVLCDLRYLPFSDDCAGEVISKDVLEHFENPIEILEEWYRVIKEGGTLWLRVPDWEKTSDPDFWKNTPFGNTENRVLGGRKNEYDIHKSLYTEDVLRERLKEAGFDKIAIKKSRRPPLHWHLLCRAKVSPC